MGKPRHKPKHPRTGLPGTKVAAVRQQGLIPVSDHALIRFLERVGGMDVESVRMSMQLGLSRAAAVARGMGSTDFVIKMGGSQFVVRDDVVTTVLPGHRINPLSRSDADAAGPAAD